MPAVPPHVFREYDVRGLVATELTPDFARLLGRGFGSYLLDKDPRARSVVLGRDCRESSARLREAMIEGLLACGLDVWDIGVVPTPLTYFAAHVLPVDGLAMITGSHNPPEYNGFKLGAGKTTFFGPEVQALRALIEAGRFAPEGRGRIVPFDAVTPYAHFVRQTLQLGPRRPKVVVDAGNGTGGVVAVPLFQSLGFEVVPLFIEMDGTFPNHHPDPTVPKNLEHLIAKVRETGADVGLAYDGDADRLGAVDEHGQILWGDQLMILFARDVLADHPGAAIVSEVKCSMTLYDDIARQGGRAIMWKAGHSLIKAKMKEEGALLAGEMSGHIFFKHRYYGFDDGVYASARLLEILTHTGRPLSTLLADVPRTYSSPEIRADFPEEKKFEAVRRATEKLRARYRTIEVDGVRVVFDDGWGLIRASNTQPLLVLRFEATTEARLREIQRLIEGTVEEVRKELENR